MAKSQQPEQKTAISFESEEAFVEWFWQGSNGNNLIKKLNTYSENNKSDDFIRREKESPVVYAIVLNDGKIPFKDKGKQWKLCKVGFTHCSIKGDSDNRMEVLVKEIDSKYNAKKNEAAIGAKGAEEGAKGASKGAKVAEEGAKGAEEGAKGALKGAKGAKEGAKGDILFALRIGAVDTTSFSETEKRIREKVGTPISKTKAKELGLPVPTEWVLTTQDHINGIQKMKTKKMKEVEKKGEGDVIDFFKDSKDVPHVPESQKEWLP